MLIVDKDDLIESLFFVLAQTERWDDDHAEKLDQWRKSRGEDGLTSWTWWARAKDYESFSFESDGREDSIEQARKEHGCDIDIVVAEARCWNDSASPEDNIMPFAEMRNLMTVKGDAGGRLK